MKGQKQLFSHNSDEWSTPQDLFDELNKEFNFTSDVAATDENSKCFFHLEDALNTDWVGTCFCNPPYSQWQKFVKQAYESNKKHNSTIVMLLPSRTDTKAFHEYIYNKPNVEIRFIRGRLKFGNSTNSAPFPSMIVIFKGDK